MTVKFTRVISAGMIASFNPYIMSSRVLEREIKKKAVTDKQVHR
jgi:hypothetical protein